MREFLKAVEFSKLYSKQGSLPQTLGFNEFLDHVGQGDEIRHFIFDAESAQKDVVTAESTIEINAPFKQFSVQLTGSRPIILGVADDLDNDKNRFGIAVTGLFCFELAPLLYNCFALGLYISDDERAAGAVPRPIVSKIGANEVAGHINRLLDMRKGGVVCTEKVQERFKLKKNGESVTHKIREVIHVRPKKFETAFGEHGGPIDYSHRFEVMGHWRKTSGIGKDRGGAYVVKGATWVIPHVKGPEHKPLIPKQRAYHAPKLEVIQ